MRSDDLGVGADDMSSKIVHPFVPEAGDPTEETRRHDLEDVFRDLVAERRTAVAPPSSTTRRVPHPAYLKLIALRPKAGVRRGERVLAAGRG
jgi:hypothetical protein